MSLKWKTAGYFQNKAYLIPYMTQTKSYPYILFTFSFLSVALGAMNSVLAPAYLPDILKDLQGSSGSMPSDNAGAWINFTFLAGTTMGGILLSFISDHTGRKKSLVFSLLLCGIGCGLGALCTSWQQLAATRFVVGIGVGTALVISTVVLSETWALRTKAIALGILSVAYPVGIIGSGIITYFIPHWKTALLIGILPCVLVIPAILLLEESYKPHAPLVGEEKISLMTHYKPLLSGMVVYGTMLIGLWSAFAWLPTFVESLKGDPALDSFTQRGLAVTFLGLGGLIGGICSGWFANKFGTRQVQAVCFILCFLGSLFLFKMNKSFGVDILIGSGLLGLCFGVSQGVLNILIPSLFPVQLRSSGTGLCFHVGRAFTAIAVFFTGVWAIRLGGYGNAIFIFSFVYLLGLFALLIRKYATY